MSLEKFECGREVSVKVKLCSSCRLPFEANNLGFVFLLVAFAVVLSWGEASSDQSIEETMAQLEQLQKEAAKNKPVIATIEIPKLKSRQEFQSDSQQICVEKWTKRGELDRRMYNHCMEGQMDGYEELKILHRHADQEFYSKIAFPYCSKKWTKRGISDARMMAYCLDKEVEGIKDFEYYRGKYDRDTVNKIAGRALTKFKSWNMAAYKVKQYFK